MKISKYDLSLVQNCIDDFDFWQGEVEIEYEIFVQLRKAQKIFEEKREIEGYEGMEELSESMEAVVKEMYRNAVSALGGEKEQARRLKIIAEKAAEIEKRLDEPENAEVKEQLTCGWCRANTRGEYKTACFNHPEQDGKEATLSFYLGAARAQIHMGDGTDEINLETPIRYCPMCGRKIETVESDEKES